MGANALEVGEPERLDRVRSMSATPLTAALRDELARLRTLDNAILAERDPTMWLN
jgi:hypothetical protein